VDRRYGELGNKPYTPIIAPSLRKPLNEFYFVVNEVVPEHSRPLIQVVGITVAMDEVGVPTINS
jgi:hypothetical protein